MDSGTDLLLQYALLIIILNNIAEGNHRCVLKHTYRLSS